MDNSRTIRPTQQMKKERPGRKIIPFTGGVKGKGSGQPPFIPTDAQRQRVRTLVACGFSTESISVVMQIPTATLERHFRAELQHGKVIVDAMILTGIVNQAIEGHAGLSMFWARTRAGWRDTGQANGEQAATLFSISIGAGNPSDSAAEIKVTAIPNTIDGEAEEP
jgi:hypothetical protein